jgi:hypothetical protein
LGVEANSQPGHPKSDRLLTAAPALSRRLARADALPAGKEGREAQLLRVFEVLPRRIPIAPITRQLDAGDGAYGAWLR